MLALAQVMLVSLGPGFLSGKWEIWTRQSVSPSEGGIRDLVMIKESRVWHSHLLLEEKPMEGQSQDNLETEPETHTAPVLVTREVPGHFTRRECSDEHLTH